MINEVASTWLLMTYIASSPVVLFFYSYDNLVPYVLNPPPSTLDYDDTVIFFAFYVVVMFASIGNHYIFEGFSPTSIFVFFATGFAFMMIVLGMVIMCRRKAIKKLEKEEFARLLSGGEFPSE